MKKFWIIVFMSCLFMGCMSYVIAYGIPFWKCLECGQKVQMVEPMMYGCPKGQYGRHAWVQYR